MKNQVIKFNITTKKEYGEGNYKFQPGYNLNEVQDKKEISNGSDVV